MTNDILAAMIGLALLTALPLLYKFYQARKRDGGGGGGRHEHQNSG
jgi:hypothetical protein